MLTLTPIILALLYGFAAYQMSSWRTRRHLDANSRELDDAALSELTGRMAEAQGIPPFKVHIYDIEPVNGLAAPDGRIFITRGFHDKYRAGEVTAKELASVIAHEMGHVALGHTRRRMIDFSGQNAMRTALALILNRLIPGVGVWIAGGLTSLLAARLSRRDEYEADAYASALLVKSGIGTGPQKQMFRKLDAMAHGGHSMPAWITSHPKPEQRIAAIESNEKRWGVR